jgi:group I intron endonuclease
LEALLNSGIYCITNCVTGQVYVGSSQHIRKRWNAHTSALNKGIHENAYLQRSWIKYGDIAFDFMVLEQVEPSDLIEREQLWMTQYPCHISVGGFNISPTAMNCAGVVHTAETRAKLSAMRKGVVKTEEHRRKIGDAHRGRTLPEAQRAAVSATVKEWFENNPELRKVVGDRFRGKVAHNKGKPISEEQRRKQSEKAKARYATPEGKAHLEKIRVASFSPEANKKRAEAMTGRVASDEARRKMSEAHTGKTRVGRPHTEEWKKAHSEKLKGSTHVKARSPKPEDVERWRAMKAAGSSYRDISAESGRDVATIHRYLNK